MLLHDVSAVAGRLGEHNLFHLALLLSPDRELDYLLHGFNQALAWLHRALAAGNPNFLRVARHALLQSSHEAIRTLARDYFSRAALLGDDDDRQAQRDFIHSRG